MISTLNQCNKNVPPEGLCSFDVYVTCKHIYTVSRTVSRSDLKNKRDQTDIFYLDWDQIDIFLSTSKIIKMLLEKLFVEPLRNDSYGLFC